MSLAIALMKSIFAHGIVPEAAYASYQRQCYDPHSFRFAYLHRWGWGPPQAFLTFRYARLSDIRRLSAICPVIISKARAAWPTTIPIPFKVLHPNSLAAWSNSVSGGK